MQAVFPSMLIVLGTALALWAWCAGGLPRAPGDQVLDLWITDEQRLAIEITLSFVIIAMGILAAAE